MKKIKVISLFSGCGGMDLGFLGGFEFLGTKYSKNPFEIIWANELNPAACNTYRSNIGDHIVNGDIWEKIKDIPKEADLVIGGFPCQDISVNGKGAGANGARSGLYRAMVKVVSEVKPKVFIAENVKGLLMRHNMESLKQIITDFKKIGYNVTYHLYSADDFAVPQTRERVIIVGTLAGLPEFVPPKPSTKQPITAKDAISDLESFPEDPEFSHIWSKANVSGEQGNRRLKPDRPAYTIRAECHGNIQFHYSLNRRISMREAARFQSFPDNFKFESGLRETERQIGNAVPPVFAWNIARSTLNLLKEKK